jgi:hypothetical protein
LNGDTEEFSAKMQDAWQFLWTAIRGAAETAGRRYPPGSRI